MRNGAWLSFFFLMAIAQAEVVSVKITNLGQESGQIALAVFNDPDDFPSRSNKAVVTKFVTLKGGESELVVDLEVRPGRYAIASYLDKNKNQKLDTNMVGAPKERFGFSQNPKINFSAPNFEECAFDILPARKSSQTIRLIKFF
jgi:uncharacterized protein (DUF2141 family)